MAVFVKSMNDKARQKEIEVIKLTSQTLFKQICPLDVCMQKLHNNELERHTHKQTTSQILCFIGNLICEARKGHTLYFNSSE